MISLTGASRISGQRTKMTKQDALAAIAQAEANGVTPGTLVAQRIGGSEWEVLDVTEGMSTDDYLSWLEGRK